MFAFLKNRNIPVLVLTAVFQGRNKKQYSMCSRRTVANTKHIVGIAHTALEEARVQYPDCQLVSHATFLIPPQ